MAGLELPKTCIDTVREGATANHKGKAKSKEPQRPKLSAKTKVTWADICDEHKQSDQTEAMVGNKEAEVVTMLRAVMELMRAEVVALRLIVEKLLETKAGAPVTSKGEDQSF